MQEYQGNAGSSPEEVAETLVRESREKGIAFYTHLDRVPMLAKPGSTEADLLEVFYRERQVSAEFHARRCA